jgi:hypothetical protein
LFLEVVVLVVGLESLQEVRWLGILPLEFTTGMGGVVALRRRGGIVHELSFVVLVLLQAKRGGSLRVVTVVVFLEVALVGEMVWFVLTPLSSKWLGTGFTFLVLTPVLSRLFAHVLVFEFQVGDSKNIWLIDSGCSRHMTGDRGWFSSLVPVVTRRNITFGDNGRGRVLSEGDDELGEEIFLEEEHEHGDNEDGGVVPPAEHVPTTSTTVVDGPSPTPTTTNQDRGEAVVEGEVASRREPPR